MGKIIKFDPERRRKHAKRSWTRPEDYGASSSTLKPQRRPEPQPQAAWPGTGEAPRRTRLLAKGAVAGIIALGILTSLYGLT